MSRHLGLAVARLHGALVCRPSSDVFHVYVGPLTQTGRWVPRSRRPVCNARTRRLSVLERVWSVLDLGGRRMCGRCSARLTAAAGRAEQPITRDQWVAYYRGITAGDLVTALALAASTAEVSAIDTVLMQQFPGDVPSCRPDADRLSRRLRRRLTADEKQRVERGQVFFDLDQQLKKTRAHWAAVERPDEERETNHQRAEIEAHNDALARAGRNRAARLDKLRDRAARGGYLTGAERQDLGLTG